MTNSSHGLPVLTTNASVIDVCLLLGPDELLREVPEGVNPLNNSGNNSECITDAGAHYTWVLSDGGNVASVCQTIGTETCDGAGDGYQGVWP